jgi:hypothetical protein
MSESAWQTFRDSGRDRPTASTRGRVEPARRAFPTLSASGLLSLQRSSGNTAVAGLVAGARSTPHVQRRALDWIADKLDLRDNEAELDAYEDAVDALADFKKQPHAKDRFTPSTGAGMFDVDYRPDGRLLITVKGAFTFLPGTRIVQDWTNPRAPTNHEVPDPWTKEGQDQWKAKFFEQAGSKWSGKHEFWCQKDWWESLRAVPEVRFIEAPEWGSTPGESAHFRVTVHKAGEREGSHVRKGIKNAELREEDVDYNPTTGRTVGQHEAGHMLGLGDEYPPSADDDPQAWHSAAVKVEFGHEVIRGRGDPASIMATGSKVLPEHGVTFLDALRTVTEMREWALTPKPPHPKPSAHKEIEPEDREWFQ